MAVVENDSESSTPRSTLGFGPRESADETRQAQHQVANDSPVDVNPNAILARAQANTVQRSGDNFEANADRRNKIADHMMASWGLKKTEA